MKRRKHRPRAGQRPLCDRGGTVLNSLNSPASASIQLVTADPVAGEPWRRQAASNGTFTLRACHRRLSANVCDTTGRGSKLRPFLLPSAERT